MYARVTQFDIDMVQISQKAALEQFKEMILPELGAQTGFRGLLILQNPEGRGMLVSLWSSKEAEESGRAAGGFYDEQTRKFATFYRQPPGREMFEVTYADIREGVAAGDTQ